MIRIPVLWVSTFTINYQLITWSPPPVPASITPYINSAFPHIHCNSPDRCPVAWPCLSTSYPATAFWPWFLSSYLRLFGDIPLRSPGRDHHRHHRHRVPDSPPACCFLVQLTPPLGSGSAATAKTSSASCEWAPPHASLTRVPAPVSPCQRYLLSRSTLHHTRTFSVKIISKRLLCCAAFGS